MKDNRKLLNYINFSGWKVVIKRWPQEWTRKFR